MVKETEHAMSTDDLVDDDDVEPAGEGTGAAMDTVMWEKQQESETNQYEVGPSRKASVHLGPCNCNKF